MSTTKVLKPFILIASVLMALSGCASIEPWVKPYERQNLADPIMANAHPLDDYYMTHVYENRESARGADGGTGGGCGCN